jgi:hypothetical protein
MAFLLAFHLRAPMRASYNKAAREDGVAIQPSLIQPALESIRFVTCARIEAEQQNGQGTDDYDRSYHYTQTVYVCKLHCYGARVGFNTPSFEIDYPRGLKPAARKVAVMNNQQSTLN